MTNAHETWIARRHTAEGHGVYLWADGSLTWALGTYVRGSAHPRTTDQAERALRAGWLVLGEVELYDDAEVPALVAAARWAAERGALPGEMRARLHRPVLHPVWQTIETDRDGTPRIQCWRLPRLFWPGLAVWREGGRYSIWTEAKPGSGSYAPTGIAFRRQSDLFAHLAAEAA